MEEIKTLTNQQLLDFKPAEIMKFILDNPEQEISIMERLKNNIKTRLKWTSINNDIKSAKLNPRGAGAIKAQTLKDIGQDSEEKYEKLIPIKIDLIKPDPDQARKIFDEEELRELSESIKKVGYLDPIMVSFNKEDGTYTLIGGERRVRAHKLANIDEIHARVFYNLSDEERRKMARDSNKKRVQLTPIEDGLDFLKMQNEGLSIRDIAQKENKDKNHVAARLNLTKFDQDCIDFILKQKLTNVAKLLKILETESTNHKMLLEKLSKNNLSNEDIEKFKVNNIKKLPDEKIADKKPSKPKEVDHDKFNDDGDFSQDKKEAQVEALSEKVRNEDNKKDSVSNNEENNIIKETSAIKITGAKDKKINISIDVENITGKDIEALKEFISTL
ncbi:MAG: ParB/RepB/Spo0J family partition protein [Leptotrichiaceae bacterium]|nr:ParB/RepB/Spo0J family partition protein [Leptotrichiaceae bacterium]